MLKNILLAGALMISVLALPAKTVSTKTIEDGGTGPYKAVMTVEEDLPGFAIYRPGNLQAAVKTEGRALPVVLFGNGGCATNSQGFYNYLSEIASHGYILVAQEKEPEPMPPLGSGGFNMSDPEFIARQKASGLTLMAALDYLEKESEHQGSIFYGTVDPFNVSPMGQSCGGLQALAMAVTGDERIKCLTVLNSGITAEGDGLGGFLKKSDLREIKVPTAYLIGGESDIAYKNGLDDFRRISHIPVVFANCDVGHMATYGEPHGGSFARMALAWLDWQLKGKEENTSLFTYGETGESFAGWKIESKNFNYASRIFSLDLNGNETPLVGTDDKVTYDAAGGIQGISGTTEAAVKVYLPTEEYNSGAAVIICPGGALMFHSWGNDVESMASWLNKRGIAVIGLKYRLRQMPAMPQGPMPTAPKKDVPKPATSGGNLFGVGLTLPDITGFDQITHANASPNPSAGPDEALDNAIDDALRAMKLVRAHAEEWGINPEKVGYLGYSAGGGVAIGATLRADADTRPSFLASCYGPSLSDVTVPENAPNLFVAVRARHMNVAAGMLSLFLEWKKAGANAEMYVYDDGQGPFDPDDTGTTSGAWRENFFRWMVSNGWATGQKDPGYAMRKIFEKMRAQMPPQQENH